MTKSTYMMVAAGIVLTVLVFMGEGGPVDKLTASVEKSEGAEAPAESESPELAANTGPAPSQPSSASGPNPTFSAWGSSKPKTRRGSSEPRSPQAESRRHRLRSGETGALSLEAQNIEE